MIGGSVVVFAAGVTGVSQRYGFFPALGTVVPPAILLHVSPGLAEKTVSSKVLSRFRHVRLLFAFVLLVFAAFAFLAFAFALLVAFAFLTFALTQHREIHGYIITSGGIRLCSAIVEEHRPDLRVALQDVAVQVAVVLHLR